MNIENTKKLQTASLSSPLVSIIICNFNYGGYITDCVNLVMSQGYSNIQCIIVDDCSTDGSREIIEDIKDIYPDIFTVFRTQNGGQSLASLDGLKVAKGHYVVFLDADDMLLSDFISTHINTHLSLRIPVGFSCSDMVQMNDGAAVFSSFIPFSEYIKNNRHNKIEVRNVNLPLSDPMEPLRYDLYLVNAWDRKWPWSAMSAMMFRRDALLFWELADGLTDLRYCTDVFFCYGINSLMQSVLIDAPLTAYRIHGRNGFASRVQLANVRSFDSSLIPQRQLLALNLILDHIRANRQMFDMAAWVPGQIDSIIRVVTEQIEEETYWFSGKKKQNVSTSAFSRLLHLPAKTISARFSK